MPRPSMGPLSDNDYAKINKHLALLENVRQEIEKATQAGMPCDEMDQQCHALRDRLQAIKAAYFPDRP